jgi:hypothetical protein
MDGTKKKSLQASNGKIMSVTSVKERIARKNLVPISRAFHRAENFCDVTVATMKRMR